MLRVDGLFTEYPNEQGEIVKAAQDVTFTVPEGKLFTLLGPSGCGKTTTLRSIAGLEKPRLGEIAVNDRVVYSSSRGVFVAPNRRGFGMVFQSYAIWPHMSVFENAAFPLQVGEKKRSKEQIREKVMGVLKATQLDHLADREATKLSGGQQQRGLHHKGPCQGQPLLLPARQLGGLPVGQVVQLHRLQHAHHLVAHLLARHLLLAHLQREGGILEHVHVRPDGV